MHCSYCGLAGYNIGGCNDFKLGLKPKRKLAKKKVRAEPDISSSDEEYVAMAQVIYMSNFFSIYVNYCT